MPVTGKWGVTREADGTLSFITSWPWFWRYPAALALLPLAALMFWWLQDRQALALTFGLGLAFFALCIAYELGCLVMALAVIGGVWLGITAFFPGMQIDMPTGETTLLVLLSVAAVYASRTAHAAMKKIEGLEFARDNAWVRLGRVEDEARQEIAALNQQVDRLEAQIRAMNGGGWRDPSIP